MGFGRAAINLFNSALELTGQGGDKQGVGGDVWVSLSRYEDSFVDLLEEWERRTRSSSNITKAKDAIGADGVETHEEKEGWDVGTHGIFTDGKWDVGKMVKSFARLGEYNKEDVRVETTEVRQRNLGSHRLLTLRRLELTMCILYFHCRLCRGFTSTDRFSSRKSTERPTTHPRQTCKVQTKLRWRKTEYY